MKTPKKLNILVDSRESSVTQANLLSSQSQGGALGIVEHFRESRLTDSIRRILDNCSSPETILISAYFISKPQLDELGDLLGSRGCNPQNVTVSSFACFSHIPQWCRQHGIPFIENQLKKRGISEEISSGRGSLLALFERESRAMSHEEISLKRIWIQYRLMLAIISRTELLGSVVLQLVQNQPMPGSSLEDELARAVRFFKLGEPDMAGGSYSCEENCQNNPIDLVRKRINIIAATDYNVLISGESGCGKETIAWAVHELSPRQNGPFLAINCAGLPDELLESEMFGYKKGSHNKADKEHPGFLGALNGGTLFLDELPEMSPRIQAKLLRFMESGEYRPLGGLKNRFANVRIVAAGQPHLLAEKSRVRQDLLSRINQLDITLLPLREIERRCAGTIGKMIFILLERFLWTTVFRDGSKYEITPYDIKQFQEAFQQKELASLMSRQSWNESNVRELNTFLRRWVVFGKDEIHQLEKQPDAPPHTAQQPQGYQFFDESLECFLQHADTRAELKRILALKPLKTIRNAYVRHVYGMYSRIIENENRLNDGQKKPSQKELATLMGITENTLSRYKN